MIKDEAALLEFIKSVLSEKTFDIKNIASSDSEKKDRFDLQQSEIDPVKQKDDATLQDKLNRLQREVEKKATKITCGTSRCAYRISSKKVLKVALNPAGISQNKQEAKFFGEHPNLQKHLAKVFDYDKKNNLWIIVELTNPFFMDDRSFSFWKQKTGFDYPIMEYYYIEILGNHKKPNDVLQAMIAHVTQGAPNQQIKDQMQKDVIKQHFYALKFINDVIKPISSVSGVAVGDIVKSDKIDSWGATADGRIVLLDYGLTEDIFNNFYTPPAASQTASTIKPTT